MSHVDMVPSDIPSCSDINICNISVIPGQISVNVEVNNGLPQIKEVTNNMNKMQDEEDDTSIHYSKSVGE